MNLKSLLRPLLLLLPSMPLVTGGLGDGITEWTLLLRLSLPLRGEISSSTWTEDRSRPPLKNASISSRSMFAATISLLRASSSRRLRSANASRAALASVDALGVPGATLRGEVALGVEGRGDARPAEDMLSLVVESEDVMSRVGEAASGILITSLGFSTIDAAAGFGAGVLLFSPPPPPPPLLLLRKASISAAGKPSPLIFCRIAPSGRLRRCIVLYFSYLPPSDEDGADVGAAGAGAAGVGAGGVAATTGCVGLVGVIVADVGRAGLGGGVEATGTGAGAGAATGTGAGVGAGRGAGAGLTGVAVCTLTRGLVLGDLKKVLMSPVETPSIAIFCRTAASGTPLRCMTRYLAYLSSESMPPVSSATEEYCESLMPGLTGGLLGDRKNTSISKLERPSIAIFCLIAT